MYQIKPRLSKILPLFFPGLVPFPERSRQVLLSGGLWLSSSGSPQTSQKIALHPRGLALLQKLSWLSEDLWHRVKAGADSEVPNIMSQK